MAKIGFGIVGCGNISAIHAEAIQSIRSAELRAVHSLSMRRAKEFAEKFKAELEMDIGKFLARRDIQVVNICTPSGTHARLGGLAAQAGKHVIVEKPIDVTIENAKILIDTCCQANVKLAVIFQSRFLPAVQILKKAIDRGRLGQLIVADAYVKWYRAPQYYEAARWRGTLALDGGGALINQSIHTIDLLQYLAGSVQSVAGFVERKLHAKIEGEDTGVAILRFKNGALGTIEGTTSLYPGFARRLEVHGERGSVILDGNDITLWKLIDTGEEEEELARLNDKDQSNAASDPMALSAIGHRKQIEDMIGAVLEDRNPMIDGAEGLKALEIVLSIYRSAKEKKILDLQ